MAEIHKSATIDVPAERAFDIVEDPVNTPKFVPNVTDVADINRSDARVGDSFRVIYKVIGVTFDEKFKVVEYQRPNLIKLAFEGGMSGTFNWTFAGGTGGTKVSWQEGHWARL